MRPSVNCKLLLGGIMRKFKETDNSDYRDVNVRALMDMQLNILDSELAEQYEKLPYDRVGIDSNIIIHPLKYQFIKEFMRLNDNLEKLVKQGNKNASNSRNSND